MLTMRMTLPCSYIVQLKDTSTPEDVQAMCKQLENAGTACTFQYSVTMLGFAAKVLYSLPRSPRPRSRIATQKTPPFGDLVLFAHGLTKYGSFLTSSMQNSHLFQHVF